MGSRRPIDAYRRMIKPHRMPHAQVNPSSRATIIARMINLGADIVPELKQTPEGLRSWLRPGVEKFGALIRAADTYAD